MTPTAPRTSARLLRAAAAERAELDRHRDRLLARRETLRAELERLEATLVDVDERVALLERLAPEATAGGSGTAGGAGAGSAPGMSGAAGTPGAAGTAPDATAGAPRGTPLRGTAIRETAVRVLAAAPQGAGPVHYRRWLELLEEAGYAVMGKDPAAVFLTQISRSPVVRRTTSSGMYELDRDAPERLRRRLATLQARLRDATSAVADAADLARLRAEREQALTEIAQVERALEEAARSLSRTPPRELAAAAG